jgi:hypothetical protein
LVTKPPNATFRVVLSLSLFSCWLNFYIRRSVPFKSPPCPTQRRQKLETSGDAELDESDLALLQFNYALALFQVRVRGVDNHLYCVFEGFKSRQIREKLKPILALLVMCRLPQPSTLAFPLLDVIVSFFAHPCLHSSNLHRNNNTVLQ